MVARVAVVANRRKHLGGGLDELRKLLREAGHEEVLWYEVSKSRKSGKKARKARKAGVELVFLWGGDGLVQRCVDALAGSTVAVAIVPAGTANLLATNLGIPTDVTQAVRIGLAGRRRRLDLGKVDGEHFAVMAGAGFDAAMIGDADRTLKDRVGRLAYVWTGLRHVRDGAMPVRVRVDGSKWFRGKASCVLVGNVGTIGGGVPAFADARPDDGWLDVGVATAEGAVQWARTIGRMVAGQAERSPLVRLTKARAVDVKFRVPVGYELDGGVRKAKRRLRVRVVPGAVSVCVPDGSELAPPTG
jgi:YegS/Rv2252/BmrU family lipid kinase